MVARDKEDQSGQQIGSYEIESHIAPRKASDLFLARDVKLGRLVYLEVLRATSEEDPDLSMRFRSRMETVSQLKDPHIAVVSDRDVTDDGFPYAVIDYFPAEPLASRLQELQLSEITLPVIEALELVRDIAQALGVAHAAGLIHHDLRPENIMLRQDGTPVLIDLGVPLIVADSAGRISVSTDTGYLDYASPEELEGKEVTQRSNIYSLGVILYELLAGHRPILPTMPYDIFPQANMPKEEPLEEARPGLAGETYRLVRNSLWRQEWSRFETTDEMITAIETAIFAEQELPKAAGWTPRRNQSMAVFIPVVLLALGVLAFFLIRGVVGGRNAEAEELTPGGAASGAIVAVETQDPESLPSPAMTIELPTESAVDFSISLLSPARNSEFTTADTINFDWYWLTHPDEGDQFAVYLMDDNREYQLGTLTEPTSGFVFRLQLPGELIPVTGEDLVWQVRLENVLGTEVRVASDLIPIIIREAAPAVTATPTQTAEPTATPTGEVACVVDPFPGWVLYTIRSGDSVAGLAENAGITVQTLLNVNCLPNDLLSIGQQLWVPPSALPATPTSPAPPTSSPPPTSGGSTPQPPPPSTPVPPTSEPTGEPTSGPPTEEPTATPPPPPTNP